MTEQRVLYDLEDALWRQWNSRDVIAYVLPHFADPNRQAALLRRVHDWEFREIRREQIGGH